MKKSIITLLFLCLFSVTALAANTVSITPYGEFFEYSKSPKKVEEILNLDSAELSKTINDNHITFLAVNATNTKQIQLKQSETDFSSSVVNLTNLSNESINSLLPDITGLENIKGEIVTLKAQKFVKINLRSDNGKDNYILTRYFTVANRKIYTLSFYTKDGEDTEYIDKTFLTLSSPDFLADTDNDMTERKLKSIRTVTIIGAALLSIICVVLLASIIIDIFKKKADTK
ncbi:MAG: hypothetical protein ACOYJS_06945 [Acutalibacteraceae bacterium]